MLKKKSLFEKLGLLEKIDYQAQIEEEENDINELPKVKSNETKVVSHEIAKDNNDVVLHEPENAKNISHNINEVNYLDKPLSMKEVYEKYNIDHEVVKTIFIIERFLKALPVNLPNDVKRQSVLNIISASNMNVDILLKDGNDRVDILNTFLNVMTMDTENIINDSRKEIEKLEKEISKYKEMICKREELQKEQNSMIEYEIDSIKSITNFLNTKA